MRKNNNISQPSVVFADSKSQIMVADWLRLIEYSIMIDDGLVGQLKRKKASLLTHKKSVMDFSLILKLIGVSESETCLISEPDPGNYSFDIEFLESQERGKMSLRFGDGIDNCDEITLDINGIKKTYICFFGDEKKPTRVVLYHYTQTNLENGNSCFRFFSNYRVLFTSKIGLETVSIDIVKPSNCQGVMKLDNEEELSNYLVELSSPIEIDELYKKICEITGLDPLTCPSVTIGSKLDKGFAINLLKMEYGHLKKLLITKDDHTIEVNQNETWKIYPPFGSDYKGPNQKSENVPPKTVEKVLNFYKTINRN